ncbi:hypothetical protein PFISCL1PPCAC_2060, partial [Pristionchus fissidentatus]
SVTIIDLLVLPFVLQWTILPLLLLLCFSKKKKDSQETLRTDRMKLSQRNSNASLSHHQVFIHSPIPQPSPQAQFQFAVDPNSPLAMTPPFREDEKKKDVKGDEIGPEFTAETPTKEDKINDDVPKFNKYSHPYGAKQTPEKSPKGKSNKASDSSKKKVVKKLVVSGKEGDQKAEPWPVRPKWCEVVPESQIQDDLSDFNLTKKTEPEDKTKKMEKKEEKKEEKGDELPKEY